MRDNKGRFTAGNKGKPKGAKNRSTKELRNFITNFINDNLETIQDDFTALEPKERIDTFIKLMEYALPKLNRTELSAPIEAEEKTIVINLGTGIAPDEKAS